jgi:uncharacterized protein
VHPFAACTHKEKPMSEAFVWFHNDSEKPSAAAAFYEKLLGWKPAAGPACTTMFGGASGPFASLGAKPGELAGWIPYAQVDDVEVATKMALELGAEVVKGKTRGPAGEFSIVRDPGGATLALWQKA